MLPASLVDLWASPPPGLGQRFYKALAPGQDTEVEAALRTLQRESSHRVRRGLVPVCYVDNRSFACVVCTPKGEQPPDDFGCVVRWHLDDIPPQYQAALLDRDVYKYATSMVTELNHLGLNKPGYEGMVVATQSYQAKFLDKGITPKARDLRPFQLASQNVILGLAALRYDPLIDGLQAKFWQTCEAPHMATSEGTRALCALMLCDAFQSGTTMEIDFTDHPEGKVPAVLRRYGRTLQIDLGEDLPNTKKGASISPSQARTLFLAVTPMPPRLREAVDLMVVAGVVSPERLCYALLAPIWSAIELEFLLRCSGRAASILVGGADITDRPARLAELEMARAAVMVGTMFRRLNNRDTAAQSVDPRAARALEELSYGVTWRICDDYGAVEFCDVPDRPLPWQLHGAELFPKDGRVVVVPRPHPIEEDRKAVEELEQFGDAPVVIVAPRDAKPDALQGISRLQYPDRIPDIDARVEQRLLTSRLVRA